MKSLQSAGHKVTFFVTFQYASTEDYSALQPIVIKQLPMPLPARLFLRLRQYVLRDVYRSHLFFRPDIEWLQREIVKVKPDVIIIRDALSPLSIATQHIARKHAIRTILYNQKPLESQETILYKSLKALNIIPRIRITPSRLTTKNLCNTTTNTFYVPLIVPTPDEPPAARPLDSESIKICTVAKLDLPRKKIDMFLQAILRLHKKYPIKVTIAGSLHAQESPYHLAIRAFVRKHELTACVTIRCNIAPEDMSSLYKAHDLYVLPSVKEPFSISPMEAMRFGLPVVVTDTNGMRSVVADKTGTVVRSDDVCELTNAIEKYCEDTEKITRESVHAYNHVCNNYNREAFLSAFMPLVSEPTRS